MMDQRNMSTRTKIELLGLATVLLGCALACLLLMRGGFSARDTPSPFEAFIARRMRHLAVPRGDRDLKNPVPLSPEVLTDARAHFTDHCATCHGNDGRGLTPIGQGLYPKAPDMQLESTQSLTDGELFYIIRDGVRLTGMPAWGSGTPEDDLDSWKLVHFIRHLSSLSQQELEEMKSLNPISRRELEEEQEIDRFLEGGEPPSQVSHHEH